MQRSYLKKGVKMRITSKQLDFQLECACKRTKLNLTYHPVGHGYNLFIEKNFCPSPMIREGLTKRELYEALLVLNNVLHVFLK
jgi:hypothetical protein